jgi:branched-subunit amino acid transport protein
VSFAAITLCIACKRVFIVIVVVYFVIESVRKLLDIPSWVSTGMTFTPSVMEVCLLVQQLLQGERRRTHMHRYDKKCISL